MKTIKNILLLIALILGGQGAFAQNQNPVISAIQKEVDRNKTGLKMEGMASPFFISYTIVEVQSHTISASLGTINNSRNSQQRRGIPTLLVGDYLRNNFSTDGESEESTSLFDNTGIPVTIWRGLDEAYKTAVEKFKAKMATQQQQTQTEEEKNLPDFEQVAPVNIVLQPATLNFDKDYWENYLRKASETAKQYPDILNSSLSLNVQNIMSYTYNTEGSRYAVPNTVYQLTFTASTRAEDGQDLSRTMRVDNKTFAQMPDLATFSEQCKTMMEGLINLKNAPVIDEAYSGPVLFEGLAAVSIFRQALLNSKLAASPVRAAKQPNSMITVLLNMVTNILGSGGGSLELMLNKKVISRDITVKSITGQEFYNGKKLNGYYQVDAEGVVPDKELMLIENGVLRTMLNGRKPTKKIGHSNGHARFDNESNLMVVPGNILITSSNTYSNEALRTKLLTAAKEEDLDYALIVRAMESNDLNLIYKVYVADGREELVRGAVITDAGNLKAFKRILGSSDQEQMVNYATGGTVQSTVIAPSALLFEEMDITRKSEIEFKKSYIVPRPQ